MQPEDMVRAVNRHVKALSVIQIPVAIKKILDHLHLPTELPTPKRQLIFQLYLLPHAADLQLVASKRCQGPSKRCQGPM